MAGAAAATNNVILQTFPLASGQTQVLILDTQKMVLACYHVDTGSGIIALQSVRPIAADMQLDGFNTERPQPAEVRAMIGQ